MIVKMIQGLGNKLEAKIDNLKETLNEEIEDVRINKAEMQNTITEIKYSLEGTNSRIQKVEELISEVEDRIVEITEKKD